jgi:multiple sugar transport system permease protein
MVGVAWKLMLLPSGGLVNGILTRLNILPAPQSFLGETPWAALSIALVDTWQWTPFVVLLAYAALQTLPLDIEAAARIDGANVWQRFIYIKLPMLAPSLAAIFLLKLILSFKIFDLIYVLTVGGPEWTRTSRRSRSGEHCSRILTLVWLRLRQLSFHSWSA